MRVHGGSLRGSGEEGARVGAKVVVQTPSET